MDGMDGQEEGDEDEQLDDEDDPGLDDPNQQ